MKNNNEYRYMIYNDLKKEYQFPRICETTEKGANTLLFKFIRNDARKYRFKIVKVEKEKAYQIVKDLKMKYKAERIHRELDNIPLLKITELVQENERLSDKKRQRYKDNTSYKTYKEWCKELKEKEHIRILDSDGFRNIKNFNENMKFTEEEFAKRLIYCTIIQEKKG